MEGVAIGVDLQIVPTLDGISAGTLTPGARIRLSGTGIPEGRTTPGDEVVYGFGAASVTDTDGQPAPDVFSALDVALQIDLNVPADATGSTLNNTECSKLKCSKRPMRLTVSDFSHLNSELVSDIMPSALCLLS